LGFGGFFALMIAFTLLYSGWFTDGLPFAAGDRQLHWRIWLILPIHLAVQSCYTVALHVRQLIPQAQRITPRRFAVFCGLFLLAITLGNISTAAPRHANLSLGEITYRGFMSFYGLVFPAYVLLKITPSRQVATTWVWAAILLAAPFYEVGFIERQTIWLLPGVGIVLLFWVYRLFASFAPSR